LEVVFADGFDKQSLALGLDREKVLGIIERGALVQDLRFGDLIVRLIFEKEDQVNSYLLLIVQVKVTSVHPDVIFRVHSDLYPNITMLEPLMVLQLLVQRFGMVLRIGERLARFYYQEEIILKEDQLSSVVQLVDDTGHDCFGSSYVKVDGTGSRRIANCALAFCIDSVLYNDWLANPVAKKKLEAPSYRPVTRIIPIQRALEIRASCMNEPTRHDQFYKTELRLAIEIIVKLLGDAWYRRVYNNLPQVSGQEDPRLFHWYVRIIGIGHFLNQLWRADDSNNLSDKIDELRRASFEHTYFELKIAAQFDLSGFDVIFVKRKKVHFLDQDTWLKTPDLQVNAEEDGYVFVECKKKSVTGLSIDNEVEDAASQIQEYGGPGVIIIELQEKLNQESVKTMHERAKTLLEGKNKVSMLVFCDEELREEGNTSVVGTHAFPIQASEERVPDTVRRALSFQKPSEWLPLSTYLPPETSR
jgi:hypothetical protein